MTDYDLHGPWTGNYLHELPIPKRYRKSKTYYLLCLISIGIGGIAACYAGLK